MRRFTPAFGAFEKMKDVVVQHTRHANGNDSMPSNNVQYVKGMACSQCKGSREVTTTFDRSGQSPLKGHKLGQRVSPSLQETPIVRMYPKAHRRFKHWRVWRVLTSLLGRTMARRWRRTWTIAGVDTGSSDWTCTTT